MDSESDGTDSDGVEQFLDLDIDDDPHLRGLDGEPIESVEEYGPAYLVESDGQQVIVSEHEIEEREVRTDGSGEAADGVDRFAESTDLRYGVVEDSFDEDDILLISGSGIVVTEHDSHYSLTMSNPAAMDTTIHFDEVRFDPDAHNLFFWKNVGGEAVCTGSLGYYVLDAGHYYGLVGEWFLEQLDLGEWRTDAECPECGSAVLSFTQHSGCESPDCDFFVEGVVVDE